MNSTAEVYIGPDGRLSGVWVTLNVNGEPLNLDFGAGDCKMFVLFPEDSETVKDDFTPVDAVVIPQKEKEASDD